jgi:hypothetical protein
MVGLFEKMKFIRQFISKLFKHSDSKEYVEIHRNEPCFCHSGKKYKNCHSPILDKKGKLALWKIDSYTQKKEVKIYSKMNFKGISYKQSTNLRGTDVKATNIALNDYNPEVHDNYKFQ